MSNIVTEPVLSKSAPAPPANVCAEIANVLATREKQHRKVLKRSHSPFSCFLYSAISEPFSWCEQRKPLLDIDLSTRETFDGVILETRSKCAPSRSEKKGAARRSGLRRKGNANFEVRVSASNQRATLCPAKAASGVLTATDPFGSSFLRVFFSGSGPSGQPGPMTSPVTTKSVTHGMPVMISCG